MPAGKAEVMTTRVVSAAIVREDEDPGSLLGRKTKRILLAQRLPPSSSPYCWVTPGGKVDKGETKARALLRELQEEIDWVPNYSKRGELNEEDDPIPVYSYQGIRTNGERFYLDCFELGFDAAGHYPQPQADEHIGGIGWFTANDLRHLAFVGMLAPADNANLEALCAILEAP